MTELLNGNVMRFTNNLRRKSTLIVTAVALGIGGICGLLYGRTAAPSLQQNNANHPLEEIIVSKDRGLVFKSEDGTPLLKIVQDTWGTHVRLLGSNGIPVVELNNLHDRGGVVVGSKSGNFAYVQAQEESGTITLIGKYNKEAVEISSAAKDGSGNLFINEGKKGYHAVEISGGPNRLKSQGVITIPSDNGSRWQAP